MTDTQIDTFVEVDAPTGRVRGAWRPTVGSDVRSAAFLGIPFAEAPVGDLRFAAPVRKTRWEGVRDALDFAATAQRGDPGVTLIPEPSIPGESTLNVNVFTPRPGEEDAELPVLVWIHGGGYFAGSPASPWYDGRSFNRDGVVTVSVGYRLGFVGFGHVDGAPDNRGVRDWIAALEWVRENIRAFGGDPSRVTIAGQSAGGGAVLTLLGMEKAQHLFHGVWALSGATADVTPENARTLTATVANKLGIEPTLAAFTEVDEEKLIEAQKAATDIKDLSVLLDGGLMLGPAIDGDLLVRPTIDSLVAGVGADKPLVLGATDDEFSMALAGQEKKLRWIPLSLLLGKMGLKRDARRRYLAANPAVVAKGHAAVVGRYISDKMFKTAVIRTADARGAAPTWVYRYSYAGSPFGSAVHCIDVPFWFDCLDSPVGIPALAGPKPPQALADATHGAAVALIRESTAEWPSWSGQPGATRVFGGSASSPDVQRDGYAGVRPLL
ncbi:carboxylesterase/lipase family protein [Microbacterium sp. ASV49]|uniref:Carboxylic ester hydrolase n=1 Tax=Microbacterium candidum TaxID=3041922 RepID=A0ABT7MXS4_9MICO|nr:carboxylesterase family protein [Microbacterium sp. ASV49]MDL9979238.1 carboxylesterase family protein [Microbacterium sp. ASV49]